MQELEIMIMTIAFCSSIIQNSLDFEATKSVLLVWSAKLQKAKDNYWFLR